MIAQACALGLIGLQADGKTPLTSFMPYETVTRAQFATVVSRMLWGAAYNATDPRSSDWAVGHLKAMKKHGYMNYISGDWPSRVEKRVYAWIMFMRMDEYYRNRG